MSCLESGYIRRAFAGALLSLSLLLSACGGGRCQTYTGSAGVTALAALAVSAPTAAYGTLNVDQRTFTAERVHAGSNIASAQFDVMDGNVIARTGDHLTVRGCSAP